MSSSISGMLPSSSSSPGTTSTITLTQISKTSTIRAFSDQYALRFYPQHVPSAQLPQNAKNTLASKLNNVTVVTGADFGVTKYGAIPYQLTRELPLDTARGRRGGRSWSAC